MYGFKIIKTLNKKITILELSIFNLKNLTKTSSKTTTLARIDIKNL